MNNFLISCLEVAVGQYLGEGGMTLVMIKGGVKKN